MHGIIKGLGKAALQFAAQRFNLRRQAGLGLAFGPHQLGAKFGQARGLAFFPHHQLIAQLFFPALEFAPDVAVRQPERRAPAEMEPLRADGLQQINQGLRTSAGLLSRERV